jgi:two-component system, cell cycle sensor histidine kinase and response regulator CckA
VAPDSSEGTRLSATVLLVEDEQGLLSLAKRVLERAGYRVVAHADPETALAWWNDARHRDSVDLLLTDVVMPGMSGDEMLRQMRASKPGLTAMLMSGNADDRTDDEDYSFLGKPYTPTDLVEAVRAVLPLTRHGAA